MAVSNSVGGTQVSYFKKGESRPALTGRAARCQDARTEARALAKKHGHRVITHVDRAMVAASRDGWLFAGAYLRDPGVDERFASAFGKVVRETYVANHGTEPDRRGLSIVNGRVRATYRYTNELDLIAGALNYKRSRDLVLNVPTGHPVARQFAGV
jgi:hypothetical protein